MENPLITIIIPVYNVECYLRRCVDSVLAQTYTNFKVILVDDGSPDACPAICDEYAAADNRICVIHKENGGLSSARNAALDCHHGGLFIFFLDSDDFLHPQALELLMNIQQKDNADIVQCSFVRGNKNCFPEIAIKCDSKTYNNRDIFWSGKQKQIVWAKLYKTEVWNGIRMPLGKVNEDDAVSWKLYWASKKISVTNMPLYYYYINPNSTMANLQKELRLDFLDFHKERIAYFHDIHDSMLEQISQWRFCLPLMISSVKSQAITPEQLRLFRKLFKENVWPALKCTKVPLSHKLLLFLFLVFPRTCRFLGTKIL